MAILNTYEFLAISSLIVPERVAIAFEEHLISYSELEERVNKLANAMAEAGVKKGDRVALMQVNTHQAIEIYFATAQLDAIYVPINFRAKVDELDQMLTISEPSLIFIGSRYIPLVDQLIEQKLISMN